MSHAERRPVEESPSASPAEAGALRRVLRRVRSLLATVRHGPAEPGPAVAREAAVPAARVLLVEDDALVARAVALMLERLGHAVTTCGDGAEALERFRADPAGFDVVLTDETLPGLRGDRLAEALLALRPALPVVVCTGFGEHLDEARARELGVRALLLKPIGIAQLEEALCAALGTKR